MRLKWLMALFTIVGCTKGPPPLSIYTSLDADEAKIFLNAYEKATGERIRFVRLSTGEALARIRSEAKHPQVALWLGGPAAEYAVADMEGLLAPYQPKADFPIQPAHHSATWGWSGWYMGVVGFGTNTEFLKANNLPAPTTYEDLLHPAYTGRVSMAYAYTSGTAYTILASLVQLMGEEQAFAFVKQLDTQVHHYNKSGSACVTQVGLGEIAVCLAFSQDILAKGIAKGYPLTLSFPRDGVGYEIGGVALIKGGPEEARAKRFIDWLFTQPAQDLIGQWHKIPLHPEARLVEAAAKAKGTHLVSVDLQRDARQHDRLLARWRQVTGK